MLLPDWDRGGGATSRSFVSMGRKVREKPLPGSRAFRQAHRAPCPIMAVMGARLRWHARALAGVRHVSVRPGGWWRHPETGDWMEPGSGAGWRSCRGGFTKGSGGKPEEETSNNGCQAPLAVSGPSDPGGECKSVPPSGLVLPPSSHLNYEAIPLNVKGNTEVVDNDSAYDAPPGPWRAPTPNTGECKIRAQDGMPVMLTPTGGVVVEDDAPGPTILPW